MSGVTQNAGTDTPTRAITDPTWLIRATAEGDCETLDGRRPRWDDVVEVHTEEGYDDGVEVNPTPFARAVAALGDVAAEVLYWERWTELSPQNH